MNESFMIEIMRIAKTFWLLFCAIGLILLSWWSLLNLNNGLILRRLETNGIPMEFIAPQQVTQRPGILIVHGFAGSKQLMLGYAYTLAHNGYGVMLWDQAGHGASTQRFDRNVLSKGLDTALSALKRQPEIDPQQLALIGHSMGSGVAMSAGIDRSHEIDAVVAISPIDAAVTPELPKNLSLQAGQWEPRLVMNARRLLTQAGGESANIAEGRGRSLKIIAGVEHATILFNDTSHQAALNWLNQTFGRSEQHPYRDRRMGWYGLQLLGWLMVIDTLLPKLVNGNGPTSTQPRVLRRWGGLILSPLAAAMVLKAMSWSIEIGNLGGLLVGGAVGFWFFIAGLFWLAMIAKVPRPRMTDLRLGVITFALLWVGFGVAAQVVWLPWFLNSPRLLLWGTIAIGCIPWFLAAGIAQHNAKPLTQAGWWLGQSITVILGLIVTILLLPSLGFMGILLPVFPILFALFTFLCARLKSPWAFAMGIAPLFSWLIVIPFPVI
jgi:pimeloyl-ACP methyl ester carboxylesterase